MDEAPSFRVSPQQEQLWLREPAGPTGRVQALVELEGEIEPSAFRAALERVIERHEILRTTFARHPGIRVPLQLILEAVPPRWQTLDLRTLDEAARASRLEEALTEERSRPLDFEQGPLVHALLVQRSDTSAALVLTLSSLCADEASLDVLLRELAAFFEGADVPGEPLQYADFSEWQHEQLAGPSAEAAQAYWQRAAEAASPPLIPLSHERQGEPDPAAISIALDDDLVARAADVAGRYAVTTPVVIQAAWHALLARATSEPDVVVAAVGVTPRHPDLEGAVGPIAVPLPVRTPVPFELTFAELVDQLARELAAVATHQDHPPTREILDAPTFLVRPGFETRSGGVRFSLSRIVDSGVPLPFALAHQPAGEAFRLSLLFDRAVLSTEHAEMLAHEFERLLGSALLSPEGNVGALDLLDEDDRRLLLAGFNETATHYRGARVHELFARCAAETPAAVAVTDGTQALTYAELEARANQLAHRLEQAGVAAGDVVALCTDRSVDMVVGVLGILKAGGAYLPLNHEHPPARLQHQATESAARVLVVQESLLGRVPAFDEVVCIDRERAALDTLDTATPDPQGSADDPAYIIYTSGSTGVPKGVVVTHANLGNYTNDLIRRLGADDEAYVFGMVTAISTDLGNTAFFPALCSGGTLALIRPEVAADPSAFAARVADLPLDVLKITPSHLNALLRADEARILPRRWLVLGGERLGWDLVERVRGLSGCRILNHYGPTETTVGSCTMTVEDGPGPYTPATVPIGAPISNTRCYVLDDLLQPVPLGARGRLFIAGAGVAAGYVGQPELTAERFVADPFGEGDGRMYDTGDVVRRLPDGALEFLGRADEQVKIRGFRVEPSEIENILQSHPAVAQAAVVPVEESAGEIRLVAYCTLRAPGTPEELRGHLAAWLPEVMLPSSFVMLDTLPLTSSGKVDRRALAELPVVDAAAEDDYIAPRTAVEEAVAAIWADVLGLDRVSVEADFFALGGHSLLATQVVAQVRTDFAIELPLHSLFMYPTVATLSDEIVQLMGAADSDETAQLLAELERRPDDDASRLVSELSRADEGA